jgi:hypothetical protein
MEAQTHVFCASLRPKVYREFEILSAKNLYDLGAAIVRVFGFDFDHAFGFYSKLSGRVFGSPIKYELFADMGESEARSVERTKFVDRLRSRRCTRGWRWRTSFAITVTLIGRCTAPIWAASSAG